MEKIAVGLLAGYRTCDSQVMGSSLGWANYLCAFQKAVQFLTGKQQWCSSAGKVTTGLAESNGSLPPARFMTKSPDSASYISP